MAFDKGKYDAEYNRTQVKCKRIPFNKNNPDDMELLEWLEKHGNVTAYIKRLIREDMAKTADTFIWNMDTYPVGYKDPEAIKAAEGHTIQTVTVSGNVAVTFDADTKTILMVDRLY